MKKSKKLKCRAEVKMSCVSTMAECYDTQAGQLKDMDTTTAQYAGAISAYAAREMCADQVIACASLYGDTEKCKFDGNGRLTAGNNDGSTFMGAAASSRCGLTELLAFVDTVDTVRVTEGCETALENYLTDMCTPETGDHGYPWLCVNMSRDDMLDSATKFAQQNCVIGTAEMPAEITQTVDNIMEDITEELDYQLMTVCEDELDGFWIAYDDEDYDDTTLNNLSAFYSEVYGGNAGADWGRCVENTTMIKCLAYNESGETPVASYDLARDECTFTDEWYKTQCEEALGGYYENSVCYVPNEIPDNTGDTGGGGDNNTGA